MLAVAQQKVVISPPPNMSAILQVFPQAAERGVIFSYGDTIFNPSGVRISPELMAHECVHGLRQEVAGVERWWDQYLTNPLFRLDEEIYSHHEEHRASVKRHGYRARDLQRIAERLSSPLYGSLLTIAQAKHAIFTGEVK